MPFVVNSSPGAGLRFEAGATLPDAKAALKWALDLETRGMRMIRIRDTDTGEVFDERGLRAALHRAARNAAEDAAARLAAAEEPV
jgi:hypothetical protein